MPAKNPEIRLIVRILAIVGAVCIIVAIGGYVFLKIKAPYLLHFSEDLTEYRVDVSLDTLEDARFITGMNGCENLVLSQDSRDFYISCLDGNIYLLTRSESGEIRIVKSCKPGNQALGMILGRDGMLYANIGEGKAEEWMTRGGGVFRLTRSLDSYERLTDDFQCINGLACDSSGNLYFTSGNFSFLHPEGKVYKMTLKEDGSFSKPEIYLEDRGLSNGLYFDPIQDKIFYSNTIGGVFNFSSAYPALKEVYLKLRFMEACDDLCTDIGGNIWMTDPGYGTVKMFNPGTNRLARFVIEGIGQTSSCRIRSEEGREMLYITELKQTYQPVSDNFDGRGVLVVPAQSLLKLLEPLLIK